MTTQETSCDPLPFSVAAAQMWDLTVNNPVYDGTFRPTFEAGAHSRPHLFIGGAMNTYASPDDPVFWLHHSFVDKVYAIWQECNRFFDPTNVTENQFPSSLLDLGMPYAPEVTPRSVSPPARRPSGNHIQPR